MQHQEKGEEAEKEHSAEYDNAKKQPNVNIMQADDKEHLIDADEQKQLVKKRHPIFERKVKVSGNDDFLKQIFS
jgi:hypothetical protein